MKSHAVVHFDYFLPIILFKRLTRWSFYGNNATPQTYCVSYLIRQYTTWLFSNAIESIDLLNWHIFEIYNK